MSCSCEKGMLGNWRIWGSKALIALLHIWKYTFEVSSFNHSLSLINLDVFQYLLEIPALYTIHGQWRKQIYQSL